MTSQAHSFAWAVALEETLCLAALPPRPVRVGAVVAHEMASGVRDLDQDAGHEFLGVDPLVCRLLPSVMSALGAVDDLLRAGEGPLAAHADAAPD